MPVVTSNNAACTLMGLIVVFLFTLSHNKNRNLHNASSGHRQVQTIKLSQPQNTQSAPTSAQIHLRHVPKWVSSYVTWHQEQLRYHLNDPSTKFLTVAGHKQHACGGLSDRFRALPCFILVANKTGRVLFVHWKIFRLDDFLVPPVGGLNWTLPEQFEDLGGK